MTRRRLSDDERALWRGVTGSIRPLGPRPDDEPEASNQALKPGNPKSANSKSANSKPAHPKSTKLAKSKPVAARVTATTPPASPRSPLPAPAPLGRRLRQRIARGNEALEARLDLHGLTQAGAYDALSGFLRRCQRDGVRTVLVITGKGSGDGERGVLKRQVPMWLRTAELRGFVAGFEDAGLRHGGAGALYVRLRRPRAGWPD